MDESAGPMNLFQPQFDAALDRPRTEVRKVVLVASTPRSGSHMLGHAMAASGVLGVPYEYLNPANLDEWRRRLGVTGTDDLLRALFRRRTTPNGVFGLKAHYDHAQAFGGAAALIAALPGAVIVHIRRGDVLRQAISYAIARQTGVWIAGQDAVSDDIRFDAALINRCLNDIVVQNARWDTAFREAGITPLPLFYEDVRDDIAGAVARVARHAGVECQPQDIAVDAQTRRQSKTSRTDAWVERYAEALQGDASPLNRLRDRLAKSLARRPA
ncbi:MAG: hypothetical protein KJO67_12715 [Silicimonas sp.]|nr:hypothetical protein [Silicimonas sp.]